MTHSTTVALPPSDVLERAKRFFAERVPHAAAFVEQEGPRFLVLRGQGGEEVVFNATAAAGGGGGGGGKTGGTGAPPIFRPGGGRGPSPPPPRAGGWGRRLR